MAVLALIAAIVAGLLGWTLWLAIPIGIVMFIGSARVFPDRAARIASTAWISSPVLALVVMLIGRGIRNLFN